jgi:hypothetical protein
VEPGVTVALNVTLLPSKMAVAEGVIEMADGVNSSPQSVASVLAFTEPSPVTWSYPAPASKPY